MEYQLWMGHLYKKYYVSLESKYLFHLSHLHQFMDWTVITGENYQSLAVSIPRVTHGIDFRFVLRLSFYQCLNCMFGLHTLNWTIWSYW